jgi:DNA-directed RNA polymerase specialized sigma24 family protein
VPRGVEQKLDPMEELVRLMAIDLRRRAESQSEAILELNRAGFGPSRIAELLGTTANTVNVTIQKAKKRTTSKTRGEG